MRRILIDNARRVGREKRGGARVQLELHDDHPSTVQTDADDPLSLDEALIQLERVDTQLAKLVELRYFAGMTIDDTELERQAMMDHPNIARVFDAGVTEDARPYFVMELVRGLPITEYCDNYQLGLEDRVRLF